MKLLSVSLLLMLVTACQEEPLAPVVRPPRAPQDGPVVITGRIVSAATKVGIAGANLRVIEAGASVGPDESGHYRSVLPASFRGRTVPVNVRAIGFKRQDHSVAITSDTVTLDLSMIAEMLVFDCDVQISGEAYGKFTEPGITARALVKANRSFGVAR